MKNEHLKPGFTWVFLLVAFGWTWTFWGTIALHENQLITLPASVEPLLMGGAPAAWGPLIGAVLVALLSGGRARLRGLVSSLTRVRFPVRWYLPTLLLLPAIVGGAQIIATQMGTDMPVSEAFRNPVSIPIAFAWIFFLGGPLQEEAGWRGVLTESAQRRVGALGASVIAGLIWGLWHLPLFYIPREEIYYNQPIWGLLGSTALLSVLITWVYNNTGRSLFAAMLMHTTWNWSNYLFTSLQTNTGGAAFFVLLAASVLVVVAIFGPRELVRGSS